jgi:dienelactone hydrolase
MKTMRTLAITVVFFTTCFAGEPPKLPLPSGPFGIGRVGYDWIDESRAHRELMVYLWYPTKGNQADVHGPFIPGAKQMDAAPEAQRYMRDLFAANWPLIVSGAIYSHAVDRAPVAKIRGRSPVIVFSHGAGGTGFDYTSLIEDLVSRGYVIAAIEHTDLGAVVVFPDGRTIVPHEDLMRSSGSRIGQAISEGAADVRFVLDRLTELSAGNPHQFLLAGKLDLTRVATMGHSAGAEYAARAGQLDARFKACVDLDGGMAPIAALPEFSDGATMKQPLLFLEAYHPESKTGGTHQQIMEFYKKREEQLQTCPKGSYAVVLKSPGMIHASFGDDPLLNEVSGAQHNLDLIEQFIRAFLDKTLRQTKAPLLEANVPPEATIQPYGH